MTGTARRRIAATLAAATLAVAGPAQAAGAPCWDSGSIGAARISELNTMLMVSSLRCRLVGVDLRPVYERVSALYGQAFQAAEAQIKAHFGGADHTDSRDDYDSYVVGVANYYGSGRSDPATCEAFASIQQTLAETSANLDRLATLAIQLVRDPQVRGGRCPVAGGSVKQRVAAKR